MGMIPKMKYGYLDDQKMGRKIVLESQERFCIFFPIRCFETLRQCLLTVNTARD